MIIQSQLLATKFFVPVTSGTLISRPRLTALLDKSLKYPLTLVSAPAGFGKTMLLSAWVQSLPVNNPLVAWISLDEEDNDPQLFWTYVLSALDQQEPEHFTSLLKYLQSPQAPSLKYILTALINLVLDSQEHVVLILDDYHLITEQQVHTTLAYLVEHLPSQFHIILSTRVDPSLPFTQMRVRQRLQEVRTEQLRCTVEETKAFFKEVMSLQFPDDTIQQVTARTEGWLVGLQMLGLSLPEQANPTTLLQEISGNQRYILDFLIEEVLRRQPQEVQTFLLSTCILERLTAPLCDAVVQQTGSQRILQQLEQANVFVVSLDSKRQWYRYHALFAEALHYQLEQTHTDLVPVLHHRASIWYSEHEQTAEAIVHAFHAKEWQWAADLIECKSHQLMTFTWGASDHQLEILQDWLEQLPTAIIGSRPRLCLACAYLLSMVAPYSMLNTWLDEAEARLTASLEMQTHAGASQPTPTASAQQEQENLLGEVITWRALLQCIWEDRGQAALSLCQRALVLLPERNALARGQVAWAQLEASYVSSANNAVAAIEYGLQGSFLAQAADQRALAITIMGATAHLMIGAGQLHEAQQLAQQATQLGRKPKCPPLLEVGWPALFQAEILREWNQLEAARALAEEALSLCQQSESFALLPYVACGHAVLLRIALSCRELHAACSALQEFERIAMRMNQPVSLYFHSLFTTVDQVRLWLACRDVDHAKHWIHELDLNEQYVTPFGRERAEVARVRVLLATNLPALALRRLEPVLQRATTGQRWGHVIEIRLLQALAYQMHNETRQALSALSEAVCLAEPEGYIRSFVDEGVPMATLLSQLREQQCKAGPIPYLDTLIAAFPKHSKPHKRPPKRSRQERCL